MEVATTCARDYITWKNEYPSGDHDINGVLVHRFPVERERDFHEFKNFCNRTRFSRHLFHIRLVEEKWVDLQGPYSPAAVKYIRDNGHRYKKVIFFTYLYYITVRCLAKDPVPNAILVPTAHDERSIRFGIYKDVFSAPEAFIYNSPEEQTFVERRFKGTESKPSVVTGCGIEEYKGVLPDVRKKYDLPGKYILYAGRMEPSKSCGELFQYYLNSEIEAQLILIGKAVMDIPEDPRIRYLGFVPEEDKYAIMRDATVFVNPSRYESLSIVVLESMLMRTPILVNGQCEVLRGHCLRSGGGYWYENKTDFTNRLTKLLNVDEKSIGMGKNGRRYVLENYRWDAIVEKLKRVIG